MRSQWGKLAGDYASDPKVLKLSPMAELLYLRLLAYTFQYQTEGKVPGHAVALCSRKLRHRDRLMAELIAVDLLHDDLDAGYVFPQSWSRWQSRSQSSALNIAGQGHRSRAGEGEKNRYTNQSDRSTLTPAREVEGYRFLPGSGWVRDYGSSDEASGQSD